MDDGVISSAEVNREEDSDEEEGVAGGFQDGTAAEREEANNRLRDLDRYVMPMTRKLELKGQLYKEPDSFEDKATLLLDQVATAVGV